MGLQESVTRIVACRIQVSGPATGLKLESSAGREGLSTHMTCHYSCLPIRLLHQPVHLPLISSGKHVFTPRTGNAVAAVAAASSRRPEFWCHPAMSDSCMHLGILAWSPDGKTRVPGMAFFNNLVD